MVGTKFIFDFLNQKKSSIVQYSLNIHAYTSSTYENFWIKKYDLLNSLNIAKKVAMTYQINVWCNTILLNTLERYHTT